MNDIHINNGYYRLRPATMEEIPVIWEIILQAKAQMYREGKHQWDENYPTVPILENDVRRGWGYVLVPSDDDSDIIAYGAVVFDGEPAYKGLWDGQWLSEQPYVVLHRPQFQGRHQLRQLLHAARLLQPRLHLLRPHPLRCGRTHGLRKTAVNMEQRDYIKRQIEQIGILLGRMLSTLLGLRSGGDTGSAIQQICGELKDELDIDIDSLASAADRSLR